MSDSRSTVMLVDDDPDVCDAYTEVLQEAGYEVMRANNGQEALEQLRVARQLPAVILADLMMPLMDGWQLRGALSESGAFRHIPLVVMTAGRDAPAVAASAYLHKPVSLDQLLAAVRRFATPRGAR
jgi:CheY-like chemotaxis protein